MNFIKLAALALSATVLLAATGSQAAPKDKSHHCGKGGHAAQGKKCQEAMAKAIEQGKADKDAKVKAEATRLGAALQQVRTDCSAAKDAHQKCKKGKEGRQCHQDVKKSEAGKKCFAAVKNLGKVRKESKAFRATSYAKEARKACTGGKARHHKKGNAKKPAK